MQEAATDTPIAAKMVPMKLLKNYRPKGAYEVVGWHRPELKRKDAAGQPLIVQKAEFVKGEAAPSPYPGVGFPDKIWAGTVVRLTEDEAKTVKRALIGDIEFD